jgi:sirohydrochlorin cobaltochelatase
METALRKRAERRAPKRAVVIFAHGSREPGWARPLERLRARTAKALPGVTIKLAYLERVEPSLDAAIEALHARGYRRISVVPAFIAPGGHLRHDLPRILDALAARLPELRIRLTRATGEAAPVIDATARWIARKAG